ncbi:hypothetical protein LWI29_014460 [Acer saccharum]|uniref:Small ribosomal subunit protein uS14m n=1 Tax=Acer saccharum TaxID=4024 RepID=A0AA39SQI4_ACESA|nr:hypothetical protein LWI29_014460 [Acer saccharum]
MYIRGRGKIDYLTSAKKKPKSTDVQHATWDVKNSMVMAWLVNSMEEDISSNYLGYSTAKEKWDSLTEMYSDLGNQSQIYELQLKLGESKQGSDTVTKYFGRLKRLWQDLDMYGEYTWKDPVDGAHYQNVVDNTRTFFLVLLSESLIPSFTVSTFLPSLIVHAFLRQSLPIATIDTSPVVVSNLSASSTGSMALCRQNLSSLASQCVNFCRRQMSTVADKRNIEDHKRRLLAAKYEVKRKLYKALHRDVDLPNELREKFLCKLAQLPRNSSFTRVRNRCIFTGRPRAVYEKFRMSRIVFRSLASQGMLMGIKKASW